MMRKRRQYQIMSYELYDFEMETGEKRHEGREINIAENQVTELIQSLRQRTYNSEGKNELSELIFIEINERLMKDYLSKILKNGVIINNKKYVRFVRSSSMARTGTVAFVEEGLYNEIMELISLGKIDSSIEGVISKLESYLGLAFSTTMFIDTIPNNVCIVDADKFKVVINDYVKSYKQEVNDRKEITNETISSGQHDVDVELFDGQGLHSIEYGKKVAKALGLDYTPAGYQIRMLPSIKGMSYEIDFKRFYKERNIEYIEDYKGKKWKVENLDAIWTTSMFKFSKYFEGWDEFKQLRDKYYTPLQQNVIGISKYSSNKDNSTKPTKMTYQYLQALALTGDNLIDMAEYTKDLVQRVYTGDAGATMIFLNLLVENNFVDDDGNEVEEGISEENMMATKVSFAISKNPAMIKDPYVQSFLQRQLKKTVNDMKLGRLYINGQYSFTCQDPVLMLEMIANIDGKGSLERGEFYSTGASGTYASFRSPLTHSSEVGKLNFIHNEVTDKWLSRYRNIIVLNGFDITAQQHGGSDMDGDTFMWTKDKMITSNIIHKFADGSPNYPVVDIYESEHRAKAKDEAYTIDNIIEYDLRTLNNTIGQVTNIATYFTTKGHKDLKEYDKELIIASLMQNESIDFVKHGVKTITPPDNFKDARKVKPYFLQKYKYKREANYQRNVENAPLNVLCRHIEEFEKELFAKDKFKTINTTDLLINKDIVRENREETLQLLKQLQEIYVEFKKESSKIYFRIRNKSDDEISDIYETFYNKYFYKVNMLSNNKELLSSLAVHLNYNDSNDSKIFAWVATWHGLMKTIEKTAPATVKVPRLLTEKDKENLNLGDVVEFLGKSYYLEEMANKINAIDFINKEYERKINKELKKELHNFELETALYAFLDKSADEVEEIIQAGNLRLGNKEYNGQTYASIFAENEYIASINLKDSQQIDDEAGFVDLKSMRNDVEVEVIKKFDKSMKVRLKLVV